MREVVCGVLLLFVGTYLSVPAKAALIGIKAEFTVSQDGRLFTKTVSEGDIFSVDFQIFGPEILTDGTIAVSYTHPTFEIQGMTFFPPRSGTSGKENAVVSNGEITQLFIRYHFGPVAGESDELRLSNTDGGQAVQQQLAILLRSRSGWVRYVRAQ